MTGERSARLMLIATLAALAGGAIAYFTGPDPLDKVLWAAAALGPLAVLLGEIVSDLRHGRPGVDVIALLAVAGALALGEFLTAAVIGLMLATGQYLDGYAAGRAERELTALVSRAPRQTHRFTNGDLTTVDVADVVPGDRLLVKAGEVIPVDGVVVQGPVVLDESALTGESLPVERDSGGRLSSGSVNAGSSFEMRASATSEHSTYAGIVRLVREATESRPPAVRLADRWAGWFVPITLVVAGTAWAVSGDPVRGLAVLVVATPCPLLLAVPIAIVSGISRAARRGIIFRGGGPLEILARARVVVVDKTGTLTMGEPSLRSLVSFDGAIEESEALRLAASIDQASTHVLARALVTEARRQGMDLVFPTGVEEQAGKGVEGYVDGRRVSVGNAPWLLEGKAESPEIADFRRQIQRVAPLSVFISIDGEICAAATFDDTIRPDAATTVRALRRAGVERIIMATGDHPVVAQSVGLAIGVDSVLAECTPQDKVDALDEFRSEGATVMVGDGINDAPALAAADVGVAMGARGATASSEAADVVLVVDKLQGLAEGIEIASRSRRIALQSVVIGMGLSLAAMGAAAFGLLPPIAGALTQEVIDVIAIVNALRALTNRVLGVGSPKLSPELSARLKKEHDALIPKLDGIRDAADRLDHLTPGDALRELEAIRRLLVDEVLPHEVADDRVIYPEVASLLGGEDPLAAMSRTHREIFHLSDVFGRVLDDLPRSGPEPADLRDLRRILYSLHAILRLHFDQEEELYASLDENYAAPAAQSVRGS